MLPKISSHNQWCPYKDCTRRFIVTFSNSPKLEIKQMSINRRLNKQIVYIHAIEYCSDTHTKEPTTDTYNSLDRSQICFVTQKNTHCMVPFKWKSRTVRASPWWQSSELTLSVGQWHNVAGESEHCLPPLGQARDRKSASRLAPLAHWGGGIRVPLVVGMESLLHGWKNGSLFDLVKLGGGGVKREHLFCWCLAEGGWHYHKGFLLLVCSFPGPFVRQNRLLLELLVCPDWWWFRAEGFWDALS